MNILNIISAVWFQFWFQEKNTIPLDVIRLGLGFLLFFNYVMFTPADIVTLYGSSGLFSRNVVPEMGTITSFSFFVYFDHAWQLLLFHYIFVTLCFCLMVGWQTRWVKWLVLIGHLSYFNRNEFVFYGVDIVAIAILFILCVAPIGSALSFDRARQVRKHKDRYGLDTRPPLLLSQRGFACQRLLQFQMAVIFFSAGIEKLFGNMWWVGDAPWFAMVNNETAFFPLGLFADQFWLVNLMAYGTIFIEIGYAFLIWGTKTRLYFLVAALLLHVGIAVLLGMYYFATLMALGHLAFFRRQWYEFAGRWCRERFGNMEMIYDGDCGFCKRSMAMFLAFDGLNQITTRNYRTDPSPIVPSEKVDHALYTITAEKKPIPGFDAYRHVVIRVPGMWWFAPLYFIPVLSRLVGRPIYNWVAAHRMQLSKLFFKPKPQAYCHSDSPQAES